MPVLGPAVVAYWPVGDVYQLTPKWRESHTDVDNTVRPQDEINRLEIVGDYGASEIWFTITMMDMTDPAHPVPPLETPAIFAHLSRSEGWLDYREIEPYFVMAAPPPTEEDPYPLVSWGGDISFYVTELKEWIGVHRIVNITIDAEFPSEAPERVRAGYGTLVLRD
jgi:hypothetical protein